MPGGGDTTTVQKQDPWGPAQPYLQETLPSARDAWTDYAFAPQTYQQRMGRSTLADQSNATENAQGFMRQQAYRDANRGNPLLDGAQNSLQSQIDGQGAGSMAQRGAMGSLQGMLGGGITDGVEDATQAALADAIPQATAAFSGSGMANSSQAQEGVARAATQAVAPIRYGAMENAQNRQMSAANSLGSLGSNMAAQQQRAIGMAPSMYQAGFMPAQMLGRVGQDMDQRAQAERDTNVANYRQMAGRRAQNLSGYQQMLLGTAGQGGQATQTAPGPSAAKKVGGAALGGLGTYGALAMNPATAPFAIAGGIGAGLMGVL